MKINKKIRIKVLKRMIQRLKDKLENISHYGYDDGFKVYRDLDYWESKYMELTSKLL